ncbi:hypothetical protein [Microbacterium thalassium]|uniref:N-acetyltransferase n=1 Tax=Microbacterium thalassium TaxID=362649 RepID=A0A7X0FML4_9MICO|nr:hypothetical protein [Microbacterium thalassium]MBB6389815.1 hypothetical protein [Microbacterium thalassium]GLK24503.1 hypothetical protein GCM10017607_18210 [Microbacterium thalassium]
MNTTADPGALAPAREVPDAGGGVARLGVRRARLGALVDAYPAGAHDLELLVEGRPAPTELARTAAEALAADPRCRRIVFAVPEQDLDAIAWAEEAGFRYVVDVEVRAGAFSLMVVEPDWVLAQPHILEDIPLKE